MNPKLLPMMLLRRNYATVAFLPPSFPVDKTMAMVGLADNTIAAVGPASKTMALVGPVDGTVAMVGLASKTTTKVGPGSAAVEVPV